MRYKIAGVDARDRMQQREAIVEAKDQAEARAEAAKLGIDVLEVTITHETGPSAIRVLLGLFLGGLVGAFVGGLLGVMVGFSEGGSANDIHSAPFLILAAYCSVGVIFGAPVGSGIGAIIASRRKR